MNFDANCIFCKIIKNEMPSKKVYEDDIMLAFHDINPNAPIHVLVVPKEHITSMNELKNENVGIISKMFLKIPELAKELGIDEKGYRVIVNNGPDSGQMVDHIHFHILGGNKLVTSLG